MTHPTQPIIYNRIQHLRTERNLSRHDFAEALGISYQLSGYIEKGEYIPDLELALRIGEFFSQPIEAIFSRTPFTQTEEERHGRLM